VDGQHTRRRAGPTATGVDVPRLSLRRLRRVHRL